MKSFLYAILMSFAKIFGLKSGIESKPLEIKSNESFYSLKASTIAGASVDFSKYKGKKVLIVNTASECGYTPQFEELEKLHEQYGSKVEILGFPCNQFGEQDPGSNKEIEQFCQLNYGVTFLMFAKVDVKGDNKSDVYKWLTDKNKNGWNSQEPTWNFCKYLIDENGELIKFYSSGVSPLDKKLTEQL